jgi:bifunctional DNA-binding transcriptional regulator/antitoxin component of YhaV-PrlF toxin-antitoxin module
MKIRRILGKRGRTTIPFEIRQIIGFSPGDVVSFEVSGNTVICVREKICDHCGGASNGISFQPLDREMLLKYMGNLSPAEQRDLLVSMTAEWAKNKQDQEAEVMP